MNKQTPQPAGRAPSLFGGSFGGSPFKALQDEMDRVFHAFSLPQMQWSTGEATGSGALGLRVDIGESDGEIQIKADLPGIAEDDVEVTLEDDMLRLRAEKKSEAEKSDKNWRVVERSHGVFERAIRVPSGIDPDKVEASFEKGVLTVTLPKPPDAASSAKRIAVRSAG